MSVNAACEWWQGCLSKTAGLASIKMHLLYYLLPLCCVSLKSSIPFFNEEFPKIFNPFTASCENAMILSVPGVPASCEKFPHPSQLNFWSTESIFNQFSVFLKTLNALCICLRYKHPRSMKRVIRSDKPVTLLFLFWSHKCDFGAEPRSRIIATLAVKGLRRQASDLDLDCDHAKWCLFY
jgi:hypothetical protein